MDRKKWHMAIERQICWILGCTLFIIANETLFRKLQANIGGLGFYLSLAAFLVVMLCRLILHGIDARKAFKAAEASMAAIDRMDDRAFADWMECYFRSKGWGVERTHGEHGIDVVLELPSGKAAVRFVRCKRKLGRMTIEQVRDGAAEIGADEGWIVTNSFFTDQARQEAGRLGVTVWDRDELCRKLLKMDGRLLYPSYESATEHRSGNCAGFERSLGRGGERKLPRKSAKS